MTPGHITLRFQGGELTFLLGAAVPTITQGYARYEEVPRPKRQSVLEFIGMDLFKMTLDGIFDGWTDRRSVEPECTLLESLAVSRRYGGVPPTLKIVGPVPHNEVEWQIETITWGDAIYDGNIRLRQMFGLSLVQRADMPAVLGNERRKDLRRWRVVTCKSGDLRELAQLMLNDSRLWRRFTNLKGRPFRDWKQPKDIKVRVPQ